jgi:intein-encoded DNA endonuclease-like protein
MPIFKTKNEKFFKKWSSEMAYVLGFFTADGSMTKNKRGAHFIEIQITDKDLLYKIRELLESNHKITELKKNDKWKKAYRLQIGSKEIFNDLIRLGMTPNKSKTIDLPDVPSKYFSDFVRGYFDGDGNVVSGYFKKADRKNKSYTLATRFASGSKLILNHLRDNLSKLLGTTGSIHCKDNTWRLNYSINDSKKLFRFMYDDGKVNGLIYLERKYKIYKNAGVV